MNETLSIRVDKWLWYARFFKTRGNAARLCEAGRLRVNRLPVSKPAAHVKPGDILTFPVGDRIRVVRLVAIGKRRGPPTEARLLYEEIEP